MNTGKTVLAQLMSFFPDYEFIKCVDKYKGNSRPVDKSTGLRCDQLYLVLK